MPALSVNESMFVEATPDKVFEAVRDFKQWSVWSPWVIAEPDCPLDFSDDGTYYAWDGKIIGSGNMKVRSEEKNKKISYDLNFVKPFKTSNTTEFVFEEKDGGTLITWTMLGKLPFFMFFMKKMMSVWIGMDYHRGLLMLKSYLERGEVLSKLEFEGLKKLDGFQYVGIRNKCGVKEIGEVMSADFKRLFEYLNSSDTKMSGNMFSIYHKADFVNGFFEYTSGFPVESIPDDLPDGLISGVQQEGNVYSLRHKGIYEHLGNAWTSGMMHAQAKLFKYDKKRHGLEIYENNPEEVSPADLMTTVYIPAK